MSPAAPKTDAPDRIAVRLFRLSLGVFFMGGFVASSISLLVPHVRIAWGLGYGAASAIQFASFSSYLLFAFPAAALVARHGYMRASAIGLGVMAVGSMLLVGGLALRNYALVLLALLAVATGATFLQIAGNNVVTLVGDPKRAAIRLNLLQGFNALGTVVGPVVGAMTLIPSAAHPMAALWSGIPFGCAALLLAALAMAFARNRDLLRGVSGARRGHRAVWWSALRDARLRWGAVAIFAYVGAEVAIGALSTDFLMSRHAGGWPATVAARLVALYWGGAMVGRFAGAALLRRVGASMLLAAVAVMAPCLVLLAVAGQGMMAGFALLAVGLANSVMYPTIYVLALPGDPERAPAGGLILCIAVVGGAVVPMLTGWLADHVGLVLALLLPGTCYLPILGFALGVQSPSRELSRTINS